MKKKILYSFMALLMLAFTACKPDEVIDDPTDPNNPAGNDTTGLSTTTQEQAADYSWDTNNEDVIYLNGTSISTTSTKVNVAGTTATIKAGGNFRVTGTLDNGQLKVSNTDGLIVRLILDNANITNTTTAPLFVEQGKKTVVIMPAGTTNSFTDALTHDTLIDSTNAAIYSRDYISFVGEGMLNVNGKFQDGINGKDEVIIKSGNITINAVDDGIRGKDFVLIHGGTLNVTTTSGDGFKSDDATIGGLGFISINGGNSTIVSKGDGISASGAVNISDGSVNVTAGGGGTATPSTTISSKGLKGDESVNVTGGTVVLSTADDAINSNNLAYISGGNITIATKSDGINGAQKVLTTGGTINMTVGGGSTATASTIISCKGIKSPVTVHLNGGDITINSADDCIHSDNAVYLGGAIINGQTNSSTGDGIHAEDSVTVNGGTCTITKSYEALEAKFITINSGSVYITATNDGVNATAGLVSGGTESDDGSVFKITGGLLNASAASGDCIDSNGDILINGGVVVGHGPTSAPELGVDLNGTFSISGGLFVASGPSTQMFESPTTSSTQKSVAVTFSSTVSANTIFNVQDASGNNLVTFKPARGYKTMIFSSQMLVAGTTFSIYTGGSSTGTNDNGYYSGGTYSGGTMRTTFTCSSTVTSVTVN